MKTKLKALTLVPWILVALLLGAPVLAQNPFTLFFGSGTGVATPADTNSGNKSGGTQRIVIATDQPQLTNALKVDGTGGTFPVSGTVTANQGTSPWIVAGGGTAGTAATGVVTIQGIASMTKLLVTPDANSAVNVAQINGVTPLMGAGNTGTGSPRVTIATDDINLAAINAVSGTTAGAAVITDANGTIQQYLRGLIKQSVTTANYPFKGFLGTAQTVINTAVDVAAGNFSVSTTTFDNTTDAVCPNATTFLATLAAPDWAAAPAAGTTVSLYLVFQNTDSTSDDTDAPSGTANNGGYYVGSWVIAAADALQRRTVGFTLPPGITAFDDYFKNETAQNMNNDGGTAALVKITPTCTGPVMFR